MKKIVRQSISILLLSIFLFAFFTSASADSNETETLFLGSFEQDKNESNGQEPIEWVVLERTDDKILLLSLYALDRQAYASRKDSSVTWEDSPLRNWLNHDFYEAAFSEEEKELILSSNVKNVGEGNQEWGISEGRNTTDHVFLLSAAEYLKYFTDRADTCSFTEASKDITSKVIKNATWWLRSPGRKQGEGCFVGDGKLESFSTFLLERGVRPAIWVKETEDSSRLPYEIFQNATALAEQSNYLDAAKLFESLGTYNNSHSNFARCKLEYAMSIDSDDYASVIEAFDDYKKCAYESTGAYEMIADEKILDAKYQLALIAQSNGAYSDAIEKYSELGHYLDSVDRLQDCFDAVNIPYQWLTGSEEKVNAGSGYKQTKPIDSKDPHFGWDLGRFLISGYTDVTYEDGVPVFLKKPGNEVTLQFILDQDINALNGNEKLTVSSEKKGVDEEFGIGKTDFGRGALFVRFKDSKNASTTTKYFNYLEAEGTNMADTRVYLKEEGTYDIALDYEVTNTDLKQVLNKTNNYRIRFTLKLKNGSGMIYLFDLGNNSELQDYSVTADGFRIDMAKSSSLKANVIRYELNQNWTALDARESRPAANGDTYNKTGYYVITMTNTETNSTLEKHLFVGDSDDLDNYITVDSSLSRFSY